MDYKLINKGGKYMKAEVTFLAHSGFSISIGQHFLLFDYFRGQFPGRIAKEHKYSIAFASHSHGDHYNKKIFALSDYNPGTRFVLSDDISSNKENVISMKPGDIHRAPDIEIYAFGSTDLGVSFGIICEGIKIFHAGDLNLWTWKKESTPQEIKQSYKMFDTELNQIPLVFKEFDIAFFPVDSRMRTDYDEGAFMFLDALKVKHFFPMHFWNKFKTAKDFQKKYKGDAIIYAVEENGQQIILQV